MYAKKYILFIVFLLILSSCGSTEGSPNQEDNKSVNSNKTSEDNFDETANEEDSSIEYNDNFGDEDGCNEEEDENNCEEEVCDEIYGCLVRDESGWLNVMQNFTNYSPPVLPKLDKPEFSKNVWHQTNGPFSGIVVAAVKSQTGFWAATDGETFSISNIYFLEKGNSVWKKMKSVNAAMLNVVVNPNNPNQVAFATKEPEPAIYISNDGGVNWSTANISSFSSKNFRTWVANLSFITEILKSEDHDSENKRKHNINEAVRGTARRLNNTPSVCKTNYIDPYLIELYLNDSKRFLGTFKHASTKDEISERYIKLFAFVFLPKA